MRRLHIHLVRVRKRYLIRQTLWIRLFDRARLIFWIGSRRLFVGIWLFGITHRCISSIGSEAQQQAGTRCSENLRGNAMSRREFTAKTRKAALLRSGKRCEAVGAWYGLEPGQRCGNDLAFGVEYDHIILDANSKDNSLENCAAVCVKCHRHKTDHHDTPTAAKTVAQSFMGMKTRPKAKIPGRPKAEPKPRAIDKSALPALPLPPLMRLARS